MAPTKVGILGAGFIADVHLESYTRFVPDAQVTAVYSRTKERAEHVREALEDPAGFHRPRPLLRRGRLRGRGHLPAELPPSQGHARRRMQRPPRHHREALVHDAGRGRRDDRRLPRAQAKADVRRGAVLRAEVRARPHAGERGRRRRHLHAEAAREALGPPQRLVLGRQPVRRRRDDGHGLPCLRLVSLDARQPRREERVGNDGHGAAQGEDERRRQHGVRRRVRGRRDRPRRGRLGEAGRHGRSHRGLRDQGASLSPTCSAATPRPPTAKRATATRRRRRDRPRAGPSRSSKKSSTRAIRTSCSTSSSACARTRRRWSRARTAGRCSR